MDEHLIRHAEQIRMQLEQGTMPPDVFRMHLQNVPKLDRDAWVDQVFGLDDVFEDSSELPAGCVPYLPCAVDALSCIADALPARADDVIVDIGSGVGRAAVVLHLLTGSRVIGIEIQTAHIEAARALVARFHLSRVTFVLGDALKIVNEIADGTVFFLYCPFSGEKLRVWLEKLERIARKRSICVCAVDLPLPSCGWLERAGPGEGNVEMYRSIKEQV